MMPQIVILNVNILWQVTQKLQLKANQIFIHSCMLLFLFQSKHLDFEDLTLCGLQPHTQYNFSVQCRPRDYYQQLTGFWSKPVYMAVTTDEDGE